MAEQQYAYEPSNGVADHAADAGVAYDHHSPEQQPLAPPSPLNGHVSPAPPSTNGDVAPPATNGSANNVNVIRKTLASWVGFSNLPNQVHRRSVR